LLGQLQPQRGTVRLGTKLQVAYFDQLRRQLDEEQTVIDNVGEGTDRIRVGEKTKHIIGYLQDFLFTPERARTQIKFLSGGERNRVLLAKLMTRPANVIVLDEPTNDLDAETLELLESQLVDFAGTVLLVSHDRTFLNNIVTSTIAFETDGIREYVGGYDEWRRAVERRQLAAQQPAGKREASRGKNATGGGGTAENGGSATPSKSAKKLSYKETRELAALPEQIEDLESDIAGLHQSMMDPEYYRQPSEVLAADQQRLADKQAALEAAYHRWEELESRA
jgi:ATP-binding cassette subfamily F protein uup